MKKEDDLGITVMLLNSCKSSEDMENEAHEGDIQLLFEQANRNSMLIEMLYEKLGIEIPEDSQEAPE